MESLTTLSSEDYLVRVSAELPTFEIPHGPDEDDSDPFQSSESATSEDSEEEADEESDSGSP